MLKLAKECKNLDVFVHVSTAYANSHLDGFIEERIYYDKREQNYEEYVNKIMAMDKDQAMVEEKKIIEVFPNTYTYAKNLTEKYLVKHQGDVKLVICRPSIIGCSIKEPIPGWTDSLSAAGGVTILAGLSLRHFILI